jgi:hypothetical protein
MISTTKPRGRPALPAGTTRLARIEIRTTAERKARAAVLAQEAGLSLAAWWERAVDRESLLSNVGTRARS